jgi:hypothetical protein
MKSSHVYHDYLDMLQSLTGLHIDYRNANDPATREKLQEQISTCQQKLTAITDKLINENPFMKGNRVSKRSKDKTLI